MASQYDQGRPLGPIQPSVAASQIGATLAYQIIGFSASTIEIVGTYYVETPAQVIFADGVFTVDAVVLNVSKVFSDSVTTQDRLSLGYPGNYQDALATSDSWAFTVGNYQADSVSPLDALQITLTTVRLVSGQLNVSPINVLVANASPKAISTIFTFSA